jgi:Ca2+/H+ antiporter, TMEM165/GDT1 family
MGAAAAAVAIEMLEALAIVMAVGMAHGFRDALLGALAAAVGVVLLCLVLGPALLAGTDLHFLRLVVGTLLLLFGLEWLRKGILRMAGRRRRSSSHDDFLEQRAALGRHMAAEGTDWAARLVSFKASSSRVSRSA